MSHAYWRKCDFQVHTPRDPNWEGARPIGSGEINPTTSELYTKDEIEIARYDWAVKFVEACCIKKIEAVALTDHHEVIMVPYVQRVIKDRRKKEKNFNLWLFPGMELTLKGGVQCIIIFDASLSLESIKQAQGILGIKFTGINELEAKSGKLDQIDKEYPIIAEELDALEELRGSYIILPNVSQGNSHTVLKEGYHKNFFSMPYVGGYLDSGQNINSLSAKNKRRISGKDKKWSKKFIYPLPTSDSRKADFSNLGSNQTWIKLSAPTAEAIRQAFLAHESRISIEPPKLPTLFITKLEVESSSILNEIKIRMSPELNTIIGGRGSGKSAIIEYLSFGLGRSVFDLDKEYSGAARLKGLLLETLYNKNGKVKITLMQDGAKFTIERNPENSYQPSVVYPNNTAQNFSSKELRNMFPALVYCQGELAELGKLSEQSTKLTDVLNLVNQDYKKEDEKLRVSIQSAKESVRKCVQELTSYWRLNSSLLKLAKERDVLLQRLDALKKMLPEQSAEDKAKISYFDDASEFEHERLQASKHADLITKNIKSVSDSLKGQRVLDGHEAKNVDKLIKAYEEIYNSFESGTEKLINELNQKREQFKKEEDKWEKKYNKAKSERNEALEKLIEHKSITSQIIDIKEQITEINNEIADLKNKISIAGDPFKSYKEALDELARANANSLEKVDLWANEIKILSSGKIRADVKLYGDTSEVTHAINTIANKTGSREANRNNEIDIALNTSTMVGLSERLRNQYLQLYRWKVFGQHNGEEEPECKDLYKILGKTDKVKNALVNLIDDTRIEIISTAITRPLVTLYYVDKDKEISFEKASEGQRAAALLFMLLEQPGGPLIIDQPEGDLDNKIISDLTEKLHYSKQKRQLIFVSHNANIVVNGSSELVVHIDLNDKGIREVTCSGAIDKTDICEAITSTMEGGEKAFKDRKNKYGY